MANGTHSSFSRMASWISHVAGRPLVFAGAAGLIVVWGVLGPVFDFSDTWQLVINTSTTIVTFLMVFLIQNTQNRDGQAVQIKLDELIRVMKGAENQLLDLEDLDEEDLVHIRARYEKLAQDARGILERGRSSSGKDEGAPEHGKRAAEKDERVLAHEADPQKRAGRTRIG